jgi:hypothetical protein
LGTNTAKITVEQWQIHLEKKSEVKELKIGKIGKIRRINRQKTVQQITLPYLPVHYCHQIVMFSSTRLHAVTKHK